MSLLSWNCRGLGNPRPVRGLHRLVKNKRPVLVFLMETKLRASKMENLKVKLGFGSIFTVDCVGRSRGLALLWNNDFVVNIINYSRRHIHAEVWSKSKRDRWLFTGFYGHPEVARRKESWSLLQHIRASPSVAWVCVGDFNEILEESEK
jgi:exonuclease III